MREIINKHDTKYKKRKRNGRNVSVILAYIARGWKTNTTVHLEMGVKRAKKIGVATPEYLL